MRNENDWIKQLLTWYTFHEFLHENEYLCSAIFGEAVPSHKLLEHESMPLEFLEICKSYYYLLMTYNMWYLYIIFITLNFDFFQTDRAGEHFKRRRVLQDLPLHLQAQGTAEPQHLQEAGQGGGRHQGQQQQHSLQPVLHQAQAGILETVICGIDRKKLYTFCHVWSYGDLGVG